LVIGVLLPATSALAIVDDRGRDKPPAKLVDNSSAMKLTDYYKAIWMSEWVACWRPSTMTALARELRMGPTISRVKTPQTAAQLLSIRAMRFLYEDPVEIKVARDGCRNGILWRYYNGH
jgi:hypothetical protein